MTVVIESKEYRAAQETLAADPIIISMASGLRSVPRSELVNEDGSIRYEFMMAAMHEYHRRGGTTPSHGMGDYAKALLMALEG